MNLFIKEDFISHAGLPLTWKVECDALTEKDYEALATIVSEKLTFCDVKGIPRGGIPFEKALKKYVFRDFKDQFDLFDHQTILKNIAWILYDFCIFGILKKSHAFVKIGKTSGNTLEGTF